MGFCIQRDLFYVEHQLYAAHMSACCVQRVIAYLPLCRCYKGMGESCQGISKSPSPIKGEDFCPESAEGERGILDPFCRLNR